MKTSILNSSTTPLGANQTFTGVGVRDDFSDLSVALKCDSDCTLYVDLSCDDGVSWDYTIATTFTIKVTEV